MAPTRTYGVWFGLSILVGIALCFIPLFNLVGYESAAACGVIFGPAAVFLTLHAFHTSEIASPLATERDRPPLDDFVRLAGRHLGLLVAPLALLTLNALRVPNCDFTMGLSFWALIPMASVLVGQTVGWTVGAVFPPKRWLRNLVAAGIVVGSAATLLAHLALQPPIIGHQWFLGYFSGSIYDEALAVPASLVAYRATNLAVVGLVVAGLEVVRRRRTGRSSGWEIGVASLMAVAAVGLWWNWQSFGIGIDRDYIEKELGGRTETEHFVIHHPETKPFLDRRDRLAEDHEYRYDEMRRYFETDPTADGKIHSYVYADREQKGRLMGARRTLVAKIWLGEVHVLWPRYGHHLLAHELAHVFTAPFGATPLRLSVQNGVGVNMGLVEGIATAADWPAEDLTPHEATAALRRLEMAPDVRDIVGASGFWTSSSGRAYTVSGSFIQFLVDRYGIESFKRAYGWGNFREAYGKSVETLIGEWEAYLDEVELSDDSMEVARYLYRRPSIFEKVCARTTAELRRRAELAAARGDVGEMRRLYDQILGFAPENVDYRIEYAERLVDADALGQGSDLVRDLLDRSLPPVQRARLLQLRGDIAWNRDEPDEASAAYSECLDEGLPVGFRRLIGAKHASVDAQSPQVRALAFAYLIGEKPTGISLFFPMEWMRHQPGNRLAAYLVGRRLWQHREWERAEAFLEELPTSLEQPALAEEARRMLGRSLYFQGEDRAAREQFERAADSRLPTYRAEAREWLQRIDWRQSREGTIEKE